MSDRARRTIPVQRPLLPQVDRLLPHLRRIDGSRTHSNTRSFTVRMQPKPLVPRSRSTARRSSTSAWYGNGLLSRSYFAILNTTVLQPGNVKSLFP